MVSYTLVIGEKFLGKRHKENNKNIIGANAEDADTQYWVDETTDAVMVEEMCFDSFGGDFIVTLVNKKEDSLFISVTVPFEEWILKLGQASLTTALDKLSKEYKKAVDNIDVVKTTVSDSKH